MLQCNVPQNPVMHAETWRNTDITPKDVRSAYAAQKQQCLVLIVDVPSIMSWISQLGLQTVAHYVHVNVSRVLQDHFQHL